jgi:hypothetical protein
VDASQAEQCQAHSNDNAGSYETISLATLGRVSTLQDHAFLACAAAAVATMIIGFGWGGWVTGSTSRSMATTAATEARGDLAAAICVERFMAAPDSAARLVQLKAIPESYKKRQFVEAGGWATMPGQTAPDARGAEACAVTLTV